MNDTPRKRIGYTLIPNDQMSRKDLGPAHKLVMGTLGRLQGDAASCFPSLEYIAESCGLSRRTVIRVIADLKQRKEITVLHHPMKSSTYSVPWATARALRKKWAVERSKKPPLTA